MANTLQVALPTTPANPALLSSCLQNGCCTRSRSGDGSGRQQHDARQQPQQGYAAPSSTGCITNAGLLLAHGLRRWDDIDPALVISLVQASTKHDALSSTIQTTTAGLMIAHRLRRWAYIIPEIVHTNNHYTSIGYIRVWSQQTWNIDPMLFQCWVRVADSGKTMS